MALILPEVHASGLWKLKTPYDNFLNSEIWYTCIAVRKIEDYIKQGLDPKALFYTEPFNIADSTYTEDIDAGVCIVTVKDNSGNIKSFPSSYIISFPSAGGISYQALALAIDIGAIPESLDLSVIKDRIKSVVQDTLGIESETVEINLAAKTLIDGESHKRLEAAREQKKATSTSVYAKNLTLVKENTELKKQLDDSNAWILAHSTEENKTP